MSAKDNLAAALNEFRAVTPNIPTDRVVQGEKFSFKYANLGDIITLIAPHLSRCFLSFYQATTANDKLLTVVVHIPTGEKIESFTTIQYKAADPISYGTGLTFARRQGITTVLGLVPEDGPQANTIDKTEQKNKPWLNKYREDKNEMIILKKWIDAVRFLAEDPNGTIENIRTKYKVSRDSAILLKEEADHLRTTGELPN